LAALGTFKTTENPTKLVDFCSKRWLGSFKQYLMEEEIWKRTDWSHPKIKRFEGRQLWLLDIFRTIKLC
jgi:hypothetical protein